MQLTDPLALLHRQDKWYLGNGGMLIYAPPYPQHLDVPGFWDECHFGDLEVPHLLAVSIAAECPGGLQELKPLLTGWDWYPDRIEISYALLVPQGVAEWEPAGILLLETRRVGRDNTLHCELELVRETEAGEPSFELSRLHLVAWTMNAHRSEGKAQNFRQPHSGDPVLRYQLDVKHRSHARGKQPLALDIEMSADKALTSLEVSPSHGMHVLPRLDYTSLWDSLKADGKLNDRIVDENELGGVLYAGMHWAVELDDAPYRLSLRVRANKHYFDYDQRPATRPHELHDPEEAWREFIAQVPHFECSDEMLTRYYWYRWYGLRLNAVDATGNYCAPAITEGIAYFRGVITYSLMCHLYECKWLADPELARGCLRNHLHHQTEEGHLPGHIYVSQVNADGFYHTDIGRSLSELMSHHPDADFAAEVEPGLKRLLDYYTGQRDAEGLNLFDIWDQFETGQEFTSRYFHGDADADRYGWEHKLRLKGVDVTCYVYSLAQYLHAQAEAAGDKVQAGEYGRLLRRIESAVQEFLWDPAQQFFVDYSAQSRTPSPYQVAVGCYPLLYGLATPEQAQAVAAKLADGQKFATPWPTPTVPVDDPHFAADPRWRGERANCPWNGRVWPMVNSHICEIYAQLAEQDARYRPALAGYLRRFIELLHYESPGAPGKNLTRPNCYEHYHPYDGSACEYRGIDDYMHSWVVDLILKYAAGVRLSGNRLTVDPYPFGFKHFLLRNAHLRGQRLSVGYNRGLDGGAAEGFRVWLDGSEVHHSAAPERVELEL